MSSLPETRTKLTWKVPLPGGQRRLREAILFVSTECADAPFFGLVKLNKIIWRADFESFAQRGQPITGRQYQRLEQGPAPVEMRPVLNDLQAEGLLQIERKRLGDLEEQRPVALAPPVLNLFSEQDLDYFRRSIKFYWEKTGKETSSHSHGVAWRSGDVGESIPYEFAYLSDDPLSGEQRARLLRMAQERSWHSSR